jgi:hypothetical protein
MIRTLTIVEIIEDGKEPVYSISGPLPIDEAAKIIVNIAYQAIPPKKD